jgi:hypothetical protein
MNMRNILIGAGLLLAGGCAHTQQCTSAGSWSNDRMSIFLEVRQVPEHPLAVITFRNIGTNIADDLWIRSPQVMPACGATLGNNIRVYDDNQKELPMASSPHYDGPPGVNSVLLRTHSAISWSFELDQIFPETRRPGTYVVLFSYDPKPLRMTSRSETEPVNIRIPLKIRNK